MKKLDNFYKTELKVFDTLLDNYNIEEAIEKISNDDYTIFLLWEYSGHWLRGSLCDK